MNEEKNAQMVDAYGTPYSDFDCIAELNESFAKDTVWGRDVFYGIIYGQKWILPLNGNTKKQTSSFSFVKVRDDEIRPEDKAKLEALYVYYAMFQRFPPKHLDVVREMADEVTAFKEQRKRKPVSAPVNPFIDKTETSLITQDNEETCDDDF